MDVVQHGEEAYVTGEGAILVTTEAGAEEKSAGSTAVGMAHPYREPRTRAARPTCHLWPTAAAGEPGPRSSSDSPSYGSNR